MTAEFRPRTLASFNVHQLEQLIKWTVERHVIDGKAEGLTLYEAFNIALLDATVDERGKPMNERGRERLRLGFTALGRVLASGDGLSNIRGDIRVLQTTPNPDEVLVTWNIPDTRYPGTERTFQRYRSFN